MIIKSYSDDYADIFLGSHHFCVEKCGIDFIIEEIELPCNDLRYIATVATMEVALNYISSLENYLD